MFGDIAIRYVGPLAATRWRTPC